MVKNTTFASGLLFFSRARASIPLSRGIVMSATITSGRSFFAAASKASPSSTIPTSSNSSASRPFRPSATSRWSSASSTRARFTALLLYRYPSQHHCPVSGRAINVQLTADQVDALSHARQTEARPVTVVRVIKADTIIAYAKLNSVIEGAERNLRGLGFGMAADITERLLCYPKETKRNLAGRGAEAVLQLYVYRDRLHA